jgi:predicted nuclease of restriction endonuclease-like RecB superfamily
LLELSVCDGAVVPRYLTDKDEVWVRELLGEYDGLVGRPAREAEGEAKERIVESARRAGAAPRAALGVVRLCERLWRRRLEAPRPPRKLRSVVFACAAGGRPREESLAEAERLLGVDRQRIVAALFADRRAERIVTAPSSAPSPREMVQRYNLALLQGLLLRATELTVTARSRVHVVVRFAKLQRLLCTYEGTGDALRLHLSGPLSVLRHTTKYGLALARFVPAAIATPGWSFDATCRLDGRDARLAATCADPVASSHALPRDFDSAVERNLARDVRRMRTPWTLARETAVFEHGGRSFFPDFTLSRGTDRVLVEIVGYYTPEYLSAKLRALREANVPRFVVCVDESLACASEDIRADVVLRYKRHVDAAALIAAAERVAR